MTDRSDPFGGFPWGTLATEAAERFGTPSYVISWELVLAALEELGSIAGPLPVRHWLSVKTLPVPELLRAWGDLGLGVEVVSDFELLAALHEGFPPDRILVNGVAKHAWLPLVGVGGLRVHFESAAELEELADHALDLEWRIGLRFHPEGERDSEEPGFHDQFGLTAAEMRHSAQRIQGLGGAIEGLHFHLRSNVPRVAAYLEALDELAEVARELGLEPAYVDCGGGFPVEGEVRRDGVARAAEFELREIDGVVRRVAELFPSAREVWFENGRFVTARAGALVLRVLEVKERDGHRFAICDGGRVNQAIVSDWETHRLVTLADDSAGRRVPTTICGPTCMSFDRLGRFELSEGLAAGDLVLWLNAGAYHSTWESRFSFGHSAIVWLDGRREPSLARPRQAFREWWAG